MKNLFVLFLFISSALTLPCLAKSDFDLLDPTTLPPLSAYKGKVKLGMEIELTEEGMANFLRYFKPNNPQSSHSRKTHEELAKDILKILDYYPYTVTFKPRKTTKQKIAYLLNSIECVDGGKCAEFRHIVPTRDPEKYLEQVEGIMKIAGVRKKALLPLDEPEGPWFSFHTHSSNPSIFHGSLRNVAKALNILKVFEYAKAGKAEMAVNKYFSVEQKGQLRLVDKKRIETRRQSFDPHNELRRTLFLITISEKQALSLLADAISKLMTPEITESILEYSKGRVVVMDAIDILHHHSLTDHVAPKVWIDLWKRYNSRIRLINYFKWLPEILRNEAKQFIMEMYKNDILRLPKNLNIDALDTLSPEEIDILRQEAQKELKKNTLPFFKMLSAFANSFIWLELPSEWLDKRKAQTCLNLLKLFPKPHTE